MSAKIEQVEKNVVKLTIEVDAVKFEEGMEKSFRKNVGRFSVQGFRKGKAPRKIVERLYGEYVLYDDAVNFVVPEAYDKAIEENNISPVARPEIDVEEIGGGKNLIFTALVTTKPEVKLGEYKGVKVAKVEYTVTDKEIEDEINKEAEKNSRLVEVTDRPVKEQDTVYLDFEGFVDDVAFEGGKGENYPLVIGSNSFIPGFEDQLIGSETGQDVEVDVTFPEDYQSEELKGKAAKFKCHINEIKYKELPAIDDEFIKDISEFETVDEYKADIKDKLEKAAADKTKGETENNVIEKISENAEIDIPEVMIENRVEDHLKDFENRLKYQGIGLEQYFSITGTSIEDFKAQNKERAMKEVKAQLVIEAVGKAEDIKASQEDIEAKLVELAELYKKEADEIRELFKADDYSYLKEQIVVTKTIDFLIDSTLFE